MQFYFGIQLRWDVFEQFWFSASPSADAGLIVVRQPDSQEDEYDAGDASGVDCGAGRCEAD